MTPLELQKLKEDYVQLARYFSTLIDDDILHAYVADLKDLTYSQIQTAMTQLRRDPKVVRLPLPSAIRAKLTPESNPESESVLIVGRIVEAIARIGPYEVQKAKEVIGPVGWRLVSLEGGWEAVCSIESDALGVHKAQWRNLAKALIERGAGTVSDAPQIEGRSRDEGLTPLGEMLSRITQRTSDV